MSRPAVLSADRVAEAAAIIRDLTGLVFPASRRAALEQALDRAMARAHESDWATYLERLASEPRLLDDLAADITVGESYFFRTPDHFAVIAEKLLGAVPKPERPLRFWSAGCASGEEPYSLAILLHRRGLLGRARILASDISRVALAKAARACYGRWSLRDVPDDLVRGYFRRRGDEFELLQDVRDAVEFRYLNLAEDSYPSLATGVWGMDLIVCRNVLIYFDADTVARVVRRLAASLAEGGWLVLGPSDPVIAEQVWCEPVVTEAGVLYRRPARGHAADRVEIEPPISARIAGAMTPPPEPPVLSAPPLRDPPGASQWVTLVRSLADEGRLAEAGRACAAAMDRHRTSAELAYLHAALLAAAGRTPDGIAAARRALYLDRDLVVAHLLLGTLLARAGDVRGARRALRNAEALLGNAPPQSEVPLADGEPAERLVEMVRVQLRLIEEAVA